MVKKMLIEATHPEENRVVVVDGTRLEEFEVETSTKKQLKGNIYLAKVIRVEPSLQAAFVDYGNERHGFLPFSEIHPDYYQIPIADREALKQSLSESQKAAAKAEEERVIQAIKSAEESESEEEREIEELEEMENSRRRPRKRKRYGELAEAADVESLAGGNDSDEGVRATRAYFDLIRNYKIQEVIHRNQILLVQVVKEERGNKGAALTTYLSLAGRYCVLMPNNARGGGVSRKISNIADRHKLKTVVNSLPVPEGMSVIVRTAGRERTKLEIRRDYEYLIKTWVQIRDMTMESVAPCLIHEEGNLIRRSIRDLYTPDIAEILIEGEAAFNSARDFVKMIIPSHVKKVINYTDRVPLFHRYQVETQLEALHNPVVQLHSGGYLVINPTEALVAIDVNSGRSTREHSIEDTALKTNLEAVEEVARQFRLRDLAGIIVIDLIDMEEARNRLLVERRMKEVLRRDRARIQIAKINGFGLMEISRQRLHSSFIETSYHTCPYCHGSGVQRSIESISVHLLRVLEEEAGKGKSGVITLTVPSSAALYLLNHKRALITEIEQLYDVRIVVNGDDSFIAPTDYRIERQKKPAERRNAKPQVNVDDIVIDDLPETDSEEAAESAEGEGEGESEGYGREGRRRGGRRGMFGRRRGGRRGGRFDDRRGEDRGEDRGDDRSEGRDEGRDEGDDVSISPIESDRAEEAAENNRGARKSRKGIRPRFTDETAEADDAPLFAAISEHADDDAQGKRRGGGKGRGRGRGRERERDREPREGKGETSLSKPAETAVEPRKERAVTSRRNGPVAIKSAEPKGAVILFSSHAAKKPAAKDAEAKEAKEAKAKVEAQAKPADEAEVAAPKKRGRKPKAAMIEDTPKKAKEASLKEEAPAAAEGEKKVGRKGWWSKKAN